jgi:HEPN domain-containing protein
MTPPDEATIEQARELLRQARELFRQARQAWRAGDTETAARLAEQARLRVAEALVLVFGEEAYDHLYQRVNNVISWLEAQVDEGTSQLLGRIRELRNDAEQIRAQDPSGEAALIRATERLLLALQIAHRERSRQRMGEMAQHALFSVFMGDAALDLASTVVGEDPSEAQQHLLGHGSRLLERALEALSLGRYRLAFNLAREAMNVALVAVLLEPGPEEDKAAWMITVSNDAIAAAQAAVTGAGLGPTDFPVRLLELAVELQGNGIEVLANRPRVGIEILWYAAVTAQGVVNMVNAG